MPVGVVKEILYIKREMIYYIYGPKKYIVKTKLSEVMSYVF